MILVSVHRLADVFTASPYPRSVLLAKTRWLVVSGGVGGEGAPFSKKEGCL